MFHLLLGMALALDDRVWPAEDRDEVEALMSLVHHVTGAWGVLGCCGWFSWWVGWVGGWVGRAGG